MATPAGPPSRGDSPAPLYRQTPLRIACVQYDVKLGMVKDNASKVESMTAGLTPGSVDLLVLPEMCLSGYIFNTPTSILPYLEQQRIGPTSLLARSLARRLRCHVVAGYPEALPSAPVDTDTADSPAYSPPTAGTSTAVSTNTAAPRFASTSEPIAAGVQTTTSSTSLVTKEGQDAGPSSMKELEGEGTGVGWNSAVVVGPEGEVVGNYRKTFRFETDKAWAREGDGFVHFDLPAPIGRMAVGICMDINPKDFIAPWDAFELATYCRDHAVDTLVLPMNWLDPPVEPPDERPPQDPMAPSESNLNYWAARLTPLHDPTPGYFSAPPAAASQEPQPGKEVVFVGCNRVGTEEGTKFIGTSCVMTLSSDPRRIELVEVCNISEERVLLATVA